MTSTAFLLDLSRLTSRLGRGPMTGIDRAEFAYLEHFIGLDGPLFGLVRTGLGYALLDRAGVAALAARIRGEVAVGRADLLGRLVHRRNSLRARAESDIRRLALARVARPWLARMLRRVLPAGTRYFNVGHANLTRRGLAALRAVPGLRISVLVHDTIPLDAPQYCRPDTVAGFAAKMRAVSAIADLVIHTTQDARARTERQLARFGRCPPGVVAGLGVPEPQSGKLPPGIDPRPPYFVALGTIEPRKNHALLLDVWDRLVQAGGPVPRLLILGSRGWSNPIVFARLDALSHDHPVQELAGLDDGAVAALLAGAQALVFPSLAEGYGLPPIEAAALATPVISSDLAVVRELLGRYAVYLDPTDSYSWLETIKMWSRAAERTEGQARRKTPPNWADHFKTVLIHA